MTGDQTPPVGSLGEEAVKLLAALKTWADDSGTTKGTGAEPGPDSGSATAFLSDLSDHIATGGQDCRYCPLCQLIGLARATSPEVKQHLGAAASSLLQAASALLASPSQPSRPAEPGVEHINLSEEWEDD